MTEAEWPTSSNIGQLIGLVVERMYPDAEPCDWKQGERKMRLFVVACVRPIWSKLPSEYRALFQMLELLGDEPISHEAINACWSAAETIRWAYENLLFAVGYDDFGLLCHYVGRIAGEDDTLADGVTFTSLFRDIFGNPFRPVAFDPDWRTSTGVALAAGIYDEKAFERLPLLADALQDAGCANDDILTHLRSAGPHVKGCWALDLVLGKT